MFLQCWRARNLRAGLWRRRGRPFRLRSSLVYRKMPSSRAAKLFLSGPSADSAASLSPHAADDAMITRNARETAIVAGKRRMPGALHPSGLFPGAQLRRGYAVTDSVELPRERKSGLSALMVDWKRPLLRKFRVAKRASQVYTGKLAPLNRNPGTAGAWIRRHAEYYCSGRPTV